MSFLTQIYEICFMFTCSFVDLMKLTDCNYINFRVCFVGMSFADSKFLGILVCSWTEKEAKPCRKSFADLQRDALGKTGAGFIAHNVSSIEDPKEERHCKTEGFRKKGEMVGLESTNGRVWICMF